MKGERKRAVKPSPREQATGKIDRTKAMPLEQNEAYLLKELVDQSTVFGKLLKQFEQYEFALQDLLWKRKQLQQGKIKLPIFLPFAGQALYQVNDKKKVLDDLDIQVTQLTNARDGISGQMMHRRDEFIEAGLRLNTFIAARFGVYTTKNIGVQNQTTGVRVKTGSKKAKTDEKKLFEAEFNDIVNSPELQKEMKEASKKAVALNKEKIK